MFRKSVGASCLEKWVSWLQLFVGHWRTSLLSPPSVLIAVLPFSRLKLLFCRSYLTTQYSLNQAKSNFPTTQHNLYVSISSNSTLQIWWKKGYQSDQSQVIWLPNKAQPAHLERFQRRIEILGIIATFVQTWQAEPEVFSRTPSQTSICFPITVVWPSAPQPQMSHRCPGQMLSLPPLQPVKTAVWSDALQKNTVWFATTV